MTCADINLLFLSAFTIYLNCNVRSDMGAVGCPGVLPHKKDRHGCSLEIFKITLRGTKSPALWAWLEFFAPLNGTTEFSNKTVSPVIFFRRNTRLGGTAKAFAVDNLRLKTPRSCFVGVSGISFSALRGYKF